MTCPNAGCFGQVQLENHAEQSEVKPSSDSLSQKSYGAVRSLAKFGQLKPEIMRSSPKSSQVRTVQAGNHAE
ncbi:hypothetical protein [Neobacillus cucumis]|uniref:hypothetical protein n=1 Tax=Neobacillus cucumis TaxID=1740721 RepID=UPI002E1C104D|nr:hypothetical protein [Neobacillus cucumis]